MFAEGDEGSAWYIILAGDLDVVKKLDGKEESMRIATLHAGGAFGELALGINTLKINSNLIIFTISAS